MSRQFELNKALFEAVTACNYEEAERLLNLGADPLGSTDETDADEHLLGELFFAMQDNEDWVAAFPKGKVNVIIETGSYSLEQCFVQFKLTAHIIPP